MMVRLGRTAAFAAAPGGVPVRVGALRTRALRQARSRRAGGALRYLKTSRSIVRISCFPCVPDCEHQCRVGRFEPPVKRHVCASSPGNDQFTASLFDAPADQGVFRQYHHAPFNSLHGLQGSLRIRCGDELENAFQIRKRPLGKADSGHGPRAGVTVAKSRHPRGRRGRIPSASLQAFRTRAAQLYAAGAGLDIGEYLGGVEGFPIA